MGTVQAAAPRAHAGVEPLLVDFLAYLELERGLSRNTLEAYRCDLLQLGAFLDRHGVTVTEAGHGDLAAFISDLASPGASAVGGTGGRGDGGAGGNEVRRTPASAATLARKVACLRSFYRHLRREGVVSHDPTAELRGPRKTQRLPHVLSRDEVARLLREPKGTEPPALRDRALLELMYACGLRVSEATSLEVGDVDLEEGLLRARGKGSKERLVPLGSFAARALDAYLVRGRPLLAGKGTGTPALFLNARGGRISRQSAWFLWGLTVHAPSGPTWFAEGLRWPRKEKARRRCS